jgi:hypothetical protein
VGVSYYEKQGLTAEATVGFKSGSFSVSAGAKYSPTQVRGQKIIKYFKEVIDTFDKQDIGGFNNGTRSKNNYYNYLNKGRTT